MLADAVALVERVRASGARESLGAMAAAQASAPSVFTAVQEQLGMKLESSRALRETLVIDRLERPTEN